MNKLGDGYTKITNKSMDAFAKIRIPGQARQVLDFILRKTYGWNKKIDDISLSQFVEGTGLPKSAVCKNINKLLDMELITKKGNATSLFTKLGNDCAVTYGFQKDYTKWTLPKKTTFVVQKDNDCKRQRTLSKKTTYVVQKDNLTLSKKRPTKERSTKDTNTKDKVLARKKEAPKKPRKKPTGKHHVFAGWFIEMQKKSFTHHWQVEPGEGLITNNGKFYSQVAKVLEVWGQRSFEDLQYLAIDFFLDGSQWIIGEKDHDGRILPGAGHNIGVFLSSMSKYEQVKNYKKADFRKRYTKTIIRGE